MTTSDIVLFSEERLQYYIVALINNKIRIILIDTGACFNHIHISLAANIIPLEEEVRTAQYNQIHTHRYKSLEKIVFDTNLAKEIEFLVEETAVSTDPMYKTTIIGMNTLDVLNFSMNKENLILEGIRIPRIKLHFTEHEEIEQEWN